MWRSLCIALAIVALPSAHAQSTTKQPLTVGTNASTSSTLVVPDDYTIGPQDVLQIDVWKEPDISRKIPVRPDGKISLPLLNDIQAAGLTAMQLAVKIRDGLTKYITSPQVTVTVTEINSRRVFVTGEVAHVGALSMLPGMTVLQALSSTGGFTQFARTTRIYILRNQGGHQTKIPFNYKQAIKGDHPEQDILLQPGDVIVVP